MKAPGQKASSPRARGSAAEPYHRCLRRRNHPRVRGDPPKSSTRQTRSSRSAPRARGSAARHREEDPKQRSAPHMQGSTGGVHVVVEPGHVRPAFARGSTRRQRQRRTDNRVSPRMRGSISLVVAQRQPVPVCPDVCGDSPSSTVVTRLVSVIRPAHAGTTPGQQGHISTRTTMATEMLRLTSGFHKATSDGARMGVAASPNLKGLSWITANMLETC